MHGKITVKIKDYSIPLWFNNYSKVELAAKLLGSKDGFSKKPEEVQLLMAIKKRAEENHVLLMRDIITAGHKGHAYGTNSEVRFTDEIIAEIIAEAPNTEMYGAWMAFLSAYGFNLDKVAEDAKKKRLLTQEIEKRLEKST